MSLAYVTIHRLLLCGRLTSLTLVIVRSGSEVGSEVSQTACPSIGLRVRAEIERIQNHLADISKLIARDLLSWSLPLRVLITSAAMSSILLHVRKESQVQRGLTMHGLTHMSKSPRVVRREEVPSIRDIDEPTLGYPSRLRCAIKDASRIKRLIFRPHSVLGSWHADCHKSHSEKKAATSLTQDLFPSALVG